MLDPQTLPLFGLALDVIGAITIASGVITNKNNALDEFKSLAGAYADTPEDQIKDWKAYKVKIRASLLTIWGTVFLVFGFLLQAIGVFVS